MTKPLSLLKGTLDLGLQAVPEPERHEHGGAGRRGTVALMLQANPKLTPNLVKAIMQYTAQTYTGYNALTQGAGFLNTKGAVELARYFRSAKPDGPYPSDKSGARTSSGATTGWPRRHSAGRHGVGRERGVGRGRRRRGDNIVWGTLDCDGEECDNIVWGTSTENCRPGEECDNIVWGTAADDGDNIVWGTDCGGADCDNIVWGRTRRAHPARTATTSSGAPPTSAAPTKSATTSCGARAPVRRR